MPTLANDPPPVAVLAGTPFDAGLGAELLRARGVAAFARPLASCPDEQDTLQYRDPAGLARRFRLLLAELREGGTELAMLFCNSLAAVVDHDDAALPVVSPVSVYRETLPDLRSTLVVTGNAQAVLGVERTAWQATSGHRVLGLSDPVLVRGIEAGDPAAAFVASPLASALDRADELGIDAVLLACTHFTTVLPLVTAATDLPVIDVGSRLVDLTLHAITGSEPS